MPNLFGREKRRPHEPRPNPESSYDEEDEDLSEKSEDRNGGHRNGKHKAERSRPRLPGSKAVALAREYLLELTGNEPEAVTGLDSEDGQWKVTLDIVELERVPHSTDVMASYEIQIDDAGELMAYRRLGRFYRNQVERG
jgi:hypothetical protein